MGFQRFFIFIMDVLQVNVAVNHANEIGAKTREGIETLVRGRSIIVLTGNCRFESIYYFRGYKMKTTVKITALFALLAVTASSCSKLDVVGNDSVRAFNELLHNAPQLVSQDKANGGWSFSAPDNSARFFWSKNFAESPRFDVMLEFDAAPFITAGLDPVRLPGNFSFNRENNLLIAGTKLGTEQLQYNGEATPLASYQQIVKLKRGSIGYHGEMDHYGVSLGNGNMFEWAKNLSANDKDIVFVLDPDPFIAAGVDPAKINGWAFAKVTVDDANGKPVQVDKILKPFNLN
jgi:predicted small secreted protein